MAKKKQEFPVHKIRTFGQLMKVVNPGGVKKEFLEDRRWEHTDVIGGSLGDIPSCGMKLD